jgi:hypothetical protein
MPLRTARAQTALLLPDRVGRRVLLPYGQSRQIGLVAPIALPLVILVLTLVL